MIIILTHTANTFKAHLTSTQYRCFLWFQSGAFCYWACLSRLRSKYE